MVFSVIYLGFAASSDLDDAVYRADLDASRFIMKADAVNTGRLINNIGVIPRSDSSDRTFRFTCSAIGALFGDSVCHFVSPRLLLLKNQAGTFRELASPDRLYSFEPARV